MRNIKCWLNLTAKFLENTEKNVSYLTKELDSSRSENFNAVDVSLSLQ